MICRKSVQESHHYMSNNPSKDMLIPSCGHSLSCTCPDFNLRYSCEHFHVVSLCKDMLKDQSEMLFKSSKYNFEVKIINGISNATKSTTSDGLNSVKNASSQQKKTLDPSSNISNTVENIEHY